MWSHSRDLPNGIEVLEQWSSKLQARLSEPFVLRYKALIFLVILWEQADTFCIDCHVTLHLSAKPDTSRIQSDDVEALK